MIRGQSEYVTAFVVALLAILVTQLASEWISAIGASARKAVELIERSKEMLDVYHREDKVVVLNRGARKATVERLYVKLRNNTLLVRDASISVPSGQSVSIDVGYDDIDRICIETANGNAMCSVSSVYAAQLSGDTEEVGAVAIERVAPTFVRSASAVYRTKRIVAPGASLYAYAFPNGSATIVWGFEELLQSLPKFFNAGAPHGVESYIVFNYTNYYIYVDRLLDFDDSTYGVSNMHAWYNELTICIDLGKVTAGWLYVVAKNEGRWSGYGDPAFSLWISSSSCRSFTYDKALVTLGFWTARDPWTISRPWRIEARSILLYARDEPSLYLYTLEFYPATEKNGITSPYPEPIATSVSVFALEDTYLQVLEVFRIPAQG
uniref:Uncharacterized protein n=1 Tax=Ignisphaera aggregans TaxID=334771 RepID=A0A7C2VIA4_9CREN